MKKYSLVLSLLVAVASMPAVADPACAKATVDKQNTKSMTKKAIAIKAAKIAGYTAEVILPIVGLGLYCRASIENLMEAPGGIKESIEVADDIGEAFNYIFQEDLKPVSVYKVGMPLIVMGHGIYGLQKELKPMLQPLVKKLVQKYKARKAAKAA